MILAHRSTEINEFVDVIHDAGFPHDVQPNDRTAQGSTGKTVRVDGAKNMICCSAPSSTLDEFDNDSRISRDVFAQIRNHSFNPHAGSSAGIIVDNLQCLALVERSLRKSRDRQKCQVREYRNKEYQKRIVCSHREPLSESVIGFVCLSASSDEEQDSDRPKL